MHYVVQSMANEVPALFLPSAIFGYILALGRRLVVVRGIVGRAFVYLLFQLTTNADNYGILL